MFASAQSRAFFDSLHKHFLCKKTQKLGNSTSTSSTRVFLPKKKTSNTHFSIQKPPHLATNVLKSTTQTVSNQPPPTSTVFFVRSGSLERQRAAAIGGNLFRSRSLYGRSGAERKCPGTPRTSGFMAGYTRKKHCMFVCFNGLGKLE